MIYTKGIMDNMAFWLENGRGKNRAYPMKGLLTVYVQYKDCLMEYYKYIPLRMLGHQ